MNHKEALMQLSLDELFRILNKLQITPFEGAVRSWIAGKISNFYEDLNKFCSIIPDIGEKTVNDLLLYVHTKKPLNNEQTKTLKMFGIIIHKELPNDLSDRLWVWSRNKYVKTFPFKPEHVHHSFFLKFILALFYFVKVREIKLTHRKNNKNVRTFSEYLFMDKVTFWAVINALVQSGLVQKTKDIYSINESNYLRWRKESIDHCLGKFYRYHGGEKVFTFVQKIAQYQLEPNEWVDMIVISGTSIEYEQARQLGLIQVLNDNGKTYVQLTPEGWYLTKKEYHPLWNEKSLLVSAAFEVFVPYHYEPFVLFEILQICTLKDSNYFLVFDIELVNDKKNQKAVSDFYNTLMAKSTTIPDVVKHDLKDLVNL